MRNLFTVILIVVALPLLSALFYFYHISQEVDKIFLSISTFLFSIFTGFFISRQASRFNKVRETVTKFDGLMSGLYRSSGHVSPMLQTRIGETIQAHYLKILETGQWNIHFTQKSTTLASIHQYLEEEVDDASVTKLSNQALGAVVKALAAAQDVRKQMVALYKERVPFEQWVLIMVFSGMLIGTVSTVASVGVIFPSVLKATFIISVVSVLFILHRLNNLVYSEPIMGEESARDVLGIIDGQK